MGVVSRFPFDLIIHILCTSPVIWCIVLYIQVQSHYVLLTQINHQRNMVIDISPISHAQDSCRLWGFNWILLSDGHYVILNILIYTEMFVCVCVCVFVCLCVCVISTLRWHLCMWICMFAVGGYGMVSVCGYVSVDLFLDD